MSKTDTNFAASFGENSPRNPPDGLLTPNTIEMNSTNFWTKFEKRKKEIEDYKRITEDFYQAKRERKEVSKQKTSGDILLENIAGEYRK